MASRATTGADSKAILDSWKEIAVFLKRGIRTVQRWEKDEGLPVHRHQHRKRASVYGLAREIEAWFSARDDAWLSARNGAEDAGVEAAGVEVRLREAAFCYPRFRPEMDELVRLCLDARQRAEKARGRFAPFSQWLE